MLVSVLIRALARPATPEERLLARVGIARNEVRKALRRTHDAASISWHQEQAAKSVRAGLDVAVAVDRATKCARCSIPPFAARVA